MKATNNINSDLKEEIDRLMDRCSKMQILVDDSEDTIANIKKEKDKQREEEIAEKDEEINTLIEEKKVVQKELDTFKSDFKQKM